MGAFSSPSLCLFAVVVFAFQTFLLHRTFTFSLSVFPMSSIARGTCKSGFKIQQVLVNDRFKQKKVRYGSTKHRLDQAGRDSNPVNHISFLSPLLDAGYPPYVKDALAGNNILKPLLLYLPGFDGTVV